MWKVLCRDAHDVLKLESREDTAGEDAGQGARDFRGFDRVRQAQQGKAGTWSEAGTTGQLSISSSFPVGPRSPVNFPPGLFIMGRFGLRLKG